MNCDMETTAADGLYRHRCRRCGVVRTGRTPSYIRQCLVASLKLCMRIGAEVRRELCPTCDGHVQIKVFACALHGECTLEKPLAGLATCASCSDYRPC